MTWWLLLGLAMAMPVGAQQRQLSPDASQAGFRRLLGMAQAGELGPDVINANIGINREDVTIELVRRDAPGQHFQLTSRRTAAAPSRYFAIAAGAGAGDADIARLGAALDACFTSDPFGLASDFFDKPADGALHLRLIAAARAGNGAAMPRILLEYAGAQAGVSYTVAAIVFIVGGLLASIIAVCAVPPAMRSGAPRD